MRNFINRKQLSNFNIMSYRAIIYIKMKLYYNTCNIENYIQNS